MSFLGDTKITNGSLFGKKKDASADTTAPSAGSLSGVAPKKEESPKAQPSSKPLSSPPAAASAAPANPFLKGAAAENPFLK